MANELIADLEYFVITGKSGISDGVVADLPLMTLTGSFGENGNAAIDLPLFTISTSTGAVAQVETSKIDISATGLTGRLGVLDKNLPKLSCAGTGYLEVISDASGTMKRMTCSGTGYTVPEGELDDDFPYFSIYAKGSISGRFGDYVLRYTRP